MNYELFGVGGSRHSPSSVWAPDSVFSNPFGCFFPWPQFHHRPMLVNSLLNTQEPLCRYLRVFLWQPSLVWSSLSGALATCVYPYPALSPQPGIWLGSAWVPLPLWQPGYSVRAFVNGNFRAPLICSHCLEITAIP